MIIETILHLSLLLCAILGTLFIVLDLILKYLTKNIRQDKDTIYIGKHIKIKEITREK